MTRFLESRRLSWALLPALALSFACSAQDTAVSEPSASAQDALEAPAPPRVGETQVERRGYKQRGHRGFHKRGPHSLFRMALSELDLTEQQRSQITDLKADMKPAADDGARPHDELRTLLAQGLKNGKLDNAAVEKVLAGMQERMTLRRAEHVAALNKLHGILTPEQRGQLVSVLQQKANERGLKRGHGPKGGGHKFAGGTPGLPMLRGIELSREQRQQLEAVAGPGKGAELRSQHRERASERHSALAEAFASDQFDAKNLPAPDMSEHMRQRLEHKVAFVAKAATVLTPEQRSQVAERMLSGPFGPRGWGERGNPNPSVQ